MESTYSTLSEPIFDSLLAASSDVNSEEFENELQHYKLLLGSLKLQHEARLSDGRSLDELIAETETLTAPLQEEVNEQLAELRELRATSDEQHRIMRFAKDSFAKPHEVELANQEIVHITFNKPLDLLKEEEEKLENEVEQLKNELLEAQAEYDGEMHKIIDGLISTADGMRDRIEATKARR